MQGSRKRLEYTFKILIIKWIKKAQGSDFCIGPLGKIVYNIHVAFPKHLLYRYVVKLLCVMGLLTENNPNIANISWNDAFGDPQEFSILALGVYESLFGDCDNKREMISRIKYMSNCLISMLPQPADKLISLIYRYHNHRSEMSKGEIREFLRWFSPCNGGFTFDANMTKQVDNIHLDMKTLQGVKVRIGIHDLMFVQVSGSSVLHMVFRINISYCKDPFMNMYSPWSSFMNTICKFSL